eukprot:6176269-Pleurochrysis_carterae.AAC.1
MQCNGLFPVPANGSSQYRTQSTPTALDEMSTPIISSQALTNWHRMSTFVQNLQCVATCVPMQIAEIFIIDARLPPFSRARARPIAARGGDGC